MCSPHLRSLGYVLPPWKQSIHIHCFKFFCIKELSVISYLFICSVIYLYWHELRNVYFILWAIIQYYFIWLLCRLFQLWSLGVFQSVPASFWHRPNIFFFLEVEEMSILSGTIIFVFISFFTKTFFPLCRSNFLTYITFFLSEELILTLLGVLVCWYWILSVFYLSRNTLISFSLLKENL